MSGVGKAESRNNEVGNITRALKVMAQEFKCPFLVLSQLARPENDNARPTLKALRDSGCIEQDGDVIWFLHQDLDQKPEVYRVTHFELAKQRNGPVGARSMMFDCVHTRLVEKTEVAPPPAQQQRNWNDD